MKKLVIIALCLLLTMPVFALDISQLDNHAQVVVYDHYVKKGLKPRNKTLAELVLLLGSNDVRDIFQENDYLYTVEESMQIRVSAINLLHSSSPTYSALTVKDLQWEN